jgi:hypothetical protein
MPRFVILDHDWPEPHADLLLENGATLLAWRLPLPVTLLGTTPFMVTMPATRLPDHRLVYLDYEGPVSGDRGRVQRIDAGEFAWVSREEGRAVVDLSGARFRGRVEIVLEDEATGRSRVHWS